MVKRIEYIVSFHFLIFRTILTGTGYLKGDWNIYRNRAAQINLIEPVLEGVMQLFFQSIILYIVYGPGTSLIQSIQNNMHV